MSMLAEPRRKQKWSLNPRGKHWSEDQNKFGQKMLEKMGWSSGKGLGANEQGMTEHVRVSVKNNTAGFGYSNDKQDQAWTEQQENFNDFLQQLQGNQGSAAAALPENPVGTLSGKSLELKSKQSKARVHYRKFTRGKDVNKYSAKDLANIFGQKDLTKKVVKQEEDDEYIPEAIGAVDKTGGICTVNSGSISEYFKKKDFSYVQTERKTNRNSNSESEAEQYVGFGYASVNQADPTRLSETNEYAFDNPCLNVNGTSNLTDSTPTPTKKKESSKKKKNKFVFENGGLDLDDSNEFTTHNLSNTDSAISRNKTTSFVNDALNLEVLADESHNGKEFEISRTQFGLSNNGLDLTDESTVKKRVTFNDRVEFSKDSSTRTKKTTLDKFEVESSKRKKKRKREEPENNLALVGFDNIALDIAVISDEINDNVKNERKIKKTKRKNGTRISNLETIQEAVNEDQEVQNKAPIETITLEESFEEIARVDIDSTNGDLPKKKKKKKKMKDNGNKDAEKINVIDVEPVTEVIDLDETDSYINAEKAQVKQKISECNEKKRKKKKKDKGHDEPIIITLDKTIEDNGTKKKNKRKKSSAKITELSEEIQVVETIKKENTSRDTAESDCKVKLPKTKKSKKSKDKAETEAALSVNGKGHINGECNEVHVESNQFQWQGESRYRNRFSSNRYCWAGQSKMSKRMLITFFHRNLIEDFPGANIHEIKGYGEDIDCSI